MEDSLLVFLCLSPIIVCIALFITFALRHIMWTFNPIFFLINYIQWIIYNPLKFFYKNSSTNFPRRTHLFLMGTLIAPIYYISTHILMTPLRFINSLYFDVLLYWSVMLDDSISEVFNPKREGIRNKKGFNYFIHWIMGFPVRLISFIFKSLTLILDSFFMLGISLVLPTLTMYHGTIFNEAATKIGQSGKWRVGSGNFAGTGVYFGIEKRVASHYAQQRSSGASQGILIVRFTPLFTRNALTLKESVRQYIGAGGDGDKLSESLNFPWKTIEWFRQGSNTNWWEYCLVQPGKKDTFINSWRIRPIAVLQDNKISRLWGGFSLYSTDFNNFAIGSVCWVILGYFYQIF